MVALIALLAASTGWSMAELAPLLWREGWLPWWRDEVAPHLDLGGQRQLARRPGLIPALMGALVVTAGLKGGALWVLAAVAIAVAAIERLVFPKELEQIGYGLLVSVAASLINLVVARILLFAGRRHRSITLEADAHHLLTDVWTSLGVILGVGGVAVTGWLWLDPVLALLVATNIVWVAWQLLRRSTAGLMDSSLPADQYAKVIAVLDRYRALGIDYHALRTREAGARRFISLHVLVPGAWTIAESHRMAEDLEREIRDALPHASVFTHLEPIEDPTSLDDIALDR